jgi:circadian clock protein KaiB
MAEAVYQFRLYVAGQMHRSITAIANLDKLAQVIESPCQIEIVDLQRQAHSARDYGIIAIPTLLKLSPPPVRKVIGDLSDIQHVLTSIAPIRAIPSSHRTRSRASVKHKR